MLEHRPLDVPEHVRGNSFENLVELGLLERISEVAAHVSDEVVLLIMLEDAKLVRKNLVPFLERNVVGLKVLHKLDVPFFVSRLAIVHLVCLLGVLPGSPQRLLINPVDLALVNDHVVGSIFVLLCRKHRLEDFLGKRTFAVLSNLLDTLWLRREALVIGLNLLLVVDESIKLLLVVHVVLWSFGLVVSDVDILEQLLVLLLLNPGEVVHDFSLLLQLELLVAWVVGEGMLLLDVLEAHSPLPLEHHLLPLLALEEGGRSQLHCPEGKVAFVLGGSKVVLVIVVDHDLVEVGQLEGPDLVFLEPVVDDRVVGVRWVRVKRLTLDVIEVEGFIVVVHWVDSRCADYVLLARLEGLESLVVIHLVHGDIIDVAQMGGVVLHILVHAGEGHVQVEVIRDSSHDRVN